MALGWLSLQLSNSAAVVGLVAGVGSLPVVLLSMHAGALVDRMDRLRVVRITQAVFLAQAVVLWAFVWTDHATIPLLLVLALIQGVATAIEVPARQSMIIQLVGREDLQPAIALNSSGFNLARIVGPALGGLVIHNLGIAWCFGLNALSFVAVRDRNFDLGRLSIRRDHRPHEHRLAGGGVPADSFVRLEGRGTGGPRGGSDAGGGQSVAPVGPPPTPTVPAWWRGVRAPLRGPAARRRTGVGRVTPLGSRGPASMGGSAARRAPHGRRGSGGG